LSIIHLLRDPEVAALVGTPVFVDVDAATFNIDAKGIAGAVARLQKMPA
jgi:dTDP-4-amino-4,6-dideoxygalactose transaminase